jgi:hypothetical protein
VDRAQWRVMSDALATACFDDPVFGWLLPNDARRAAALRRFFAVEARHIVLARGHSVALLGEEGASGAALVLPPRRWRTPVRVPLRYGPAYLWTFGRRTPRVLLSLEHHHLRLRPIRGAPGWIGASGSTPSRSYVRTARHRSS